MYCWQLYGHDSGSSSAAAATTSFLPSVLFPFGAPWKQSLRQGLRCSELLGRWSEEAGLGAERLVQEIMGVHEEHRLRHWGRCRFGQLGLNLTGGPRRNCSTCTQDKPPQRPAGCTSPASSSRPHLPSRFPTSFTPPRWAAWMPSAALEKVLRQRSWKALRWKALGV